MQLVIVSGLPSASKSAAASALCDRYDRMLHIDVERLRDMLRMGRLRPWDDSDDGIRQRDLFIACACDMACRFLDAGYGVVIDDVITQAELPIYRECLTERTEPVHFVVLIPSSETVGGLSDRDSTRLLALHERFAAWKDAARIDSAGLPPELVADRIMSLAAEGLAKLPATF